MATIQALATKESLIAEINQRMTDGIIEESNANLLIKLISACSTIQIVNKTLTNL